MMHATSCGGAGLIHRPQPLRYVIHHILPQVCGGKTTPENTVGLCDSCHYSVHVLLHQLKMGQKLTRGTRQQRALAVQGYNAAVTAGTVDKIPDEGV